MIRLVLWPPGAKPAIDQSREADHDRRRDSWRPGLSRHRTRDRKRRASSPPIFLARAASLESGVEPIATYRLSARAVVECRDVEAAAEAEHPHARYEQRAERLIDSAGVVR